MAYRDDYEALLARVAALEEDNRRLRAENEELRRPKAPPTPARSVCPKCGREDAPHYKFCLGCGAELVRRAPSPPPPATAVDSVVCPQCRVENPAMFRFCKECGERIR